MANADKSCRAACGHSPGLTCLLSLAHIILPGPGRSSLGRALTSPPHQGHGQVCVKQPGDWREESRLIYSEHSGPSRTLSSALSINTSQVATASVCRSDDVFIVSIFIALRSMYKKSRHNRGYV